MELDEYLDSLRGEGREDSSGSFTLDLQKALEKLRQYRFPGPEFYVLHLVSAALAAGAPQVEIRSGWRSLSLIHHGRLAERDDLTELFARLFASQRDRYLEELAIGLHGATRSLEGRLALETWDPELRSGWRLMLDRSHLTVEPSDLDLGPVRTTRIALPCGRGSGAELELIRQRCAASEVPIQVDGYWLNSGLPPGATTLLLRGESAVPPTPGTRMETPIPEKFSVLLHFWPENRGGSLRGGDGSPPPRPENRGGSLRGGDGSPPGRPEASKAPPLGGRPESIPHSPVAVKLGVAYPVPCPWLLQLADQCWIYSDAWQRDLSQAKLIPDRELDVVIAQALWKGLACIPLHEDWLRGRLLAAVAAVDEGRLLTEGVNWEPFLEANWLPLATGGWTNLKHLFTQYRRLGYLAVAQEIAMALADGQTGEPIAPDETTVHVLLLSPPLRAPLRALFGRKIRHAW